MSQIIILKKWECAMKRGRMGPQRSMIWEHFVPLLTLECLIKKLIHRGNWKIENFKIFTFTRINHKIRLNICLLTKSDLNHRDLTNKTLSSRPQIQEVKSLQEVSHQIINILKTIKTLHSWDNWWKMEIKSISTSEIRPYFMKKRSKIRDYSKLQWSNHLRMLKLCSFLVASQKKCSIKESQDQEKLWIERNSYPNIYNIRSLKQWLIHQSVVQSLH